MPCVISRCSPDLVSVVFMTMELDLGQCPFTLDDAFFPAPHGGKKFLDCVWVRLLSMEPKNHMQKRSATHGGREKSWRYGWGCYPWGQESTYQRGQYHASCEWVDPLVVWYICDNLPYVRYYGFGNYIIGIHRF